MTRVYRDHWDCGVDCGVEKFDPSWEEVKALILELDGDEKTLLTFGDADEDGSDYMGIGGGRYILYLSYNDEEQVMILTDPDADPQAEVELVTGGQLGRFDARECVPLDAVLTAAETYYRSRTADERLCWSE